MYEERERLLRMSDVRSSSRDLQEIKGHRGLRCGT
jgi:hypothetical protein